MQSFHRSALKTLIYYDKTRNRTELATDNNHFIFNNLLKFLLIKKSINRRENILLGVGPT